MKIAFFSEGILDEILIPPLIRCILEKIDYNQKIDIDLEITAIQPRLRGHGWVSTSIDKIVSNKELFDKLYDLFIFLVDKRANGEMITKLQTMARNNDKFIWGYARQEIEAWVLADQDAIIDWLQFSPKKMKEFPCFGSVYEFEKDDDPKKTITNLLSVSRSDYDHWCRGAAEEFLQGRWEGEGMWEYYCSGIWTGNADLERIAHHCPEGFRPFQEQILTKLQDAVN